jgi:hypothetical protein
MTAEHAIVLGFDLRPARERMTHPPGRMLVSRQLRDDQILAGTSLAVKLLLIEKCETTIRAARSTSQGATKASVRNVHGSTPI